jgi:hypothetical protein
MGRQSSSGDGRCLSVTMARRTECCARGLPACVGPGTTRALAGASRANHEPIARTNSYVDRVTLPPDSEFRPALADFFDLLGRPAQQAQLVRLEELSLNTDNDLEPSLGRRAVQSLPDP